MIRKFRVSEWIMVVRNPRVQFFIETVNDFRTATLHNLDLFELPIENSLLIENNDSFLEMMHDFDYFYRRKTQIVSKEFRKENKGKLI